MPVVARSIQILSGTYPASTFSTTLAFLSVWVFASFAGAQDAATPEGPATPAAATPQESATAPQQAASTAAPIGDCVTEILAQQKLTRTIREIRNPLPHPLKAEADKIKKSYSQLLRAGFSSKDDTRKIQDYLGWLILQATDPEFSQSPKNMQNLLDNIRDDISNSATNATGDQSRKDAERKKYCIEVMKVTKQLLDNNLDSRLLAVRIMQALHEVKAIQNGAKAQLHADALITLLATLNDPKQPDSVKTTVGSAIRNVLMNCDVVEQDQFRICDALSKELSRPCTEAGFQMVLLDTVYEISKPRRTVGAPQPTAQRLFADVINDETKPIEVRCHAARGIGQGVYDLQMNMEPFAWKITKLAGEAALAFNKDPGNSKWPECGIDLLLAFRHSNQAGATAQPPAAKGLMNRLPKSMLVAESAPFILTVTIRLIDNKGKFTVEELTPMAQWINARQPANLTWDSNAAPVKP